MDKRSAGVTDTAEGRKRILSPPANLDFLLRRRTEFIREFVAPGERAVEIGAGLGFTKLYLPGVDVVSTDLRPKEWIDEVADAQALPFDDSEFDASIAVHVLHHIPSPRKAFHEMIRVVRPGGLVVVAEPHVSKVHQLSLKYTGHEYMDGDIDPYESDECQTKPEYPGGGNNTLGDLLFNDPRFPGEFPGLTVVHQRYVECLTFMNSGGVSVRGPSVPLPRFVLRAVDRVDRALMRWPDAFAFFQELVFRKDS